MEEGKNHQQGFQDSWFQQYGDDHMKSNNNSENYENFTSSSSSSSIGEDSMGSNGSSLSSSCDTTDDASSSNSSEGLYDLSEIMAQLPIKRGLSKFYQGKSESFTSLSSVASLEDLAKKTTPYRKQLKASKSCGAGLHSYKPYTLPKAIISKRANASSRRGSCLFSRPPLSPQLHKNLHC